jgi:hypothetical protein
VIEKNRKSALGELEFLPRFRLTVFLALNHPVIPGKQIVRLEQCMLVGEHLVDSAGNTELYGTGLTRYATACNSYLDVVLAFKFCKRRGSMTVFLSANRGK